ncbi:transcriptional regulator BetI (plasmid) [Tsukamurella tyrosinosolvens]|uniref:DNA-binding transcriptional regulator, AcrR family n=1 Tax=Tsukamurella tyrosinosolvens TaxID=57704 RepID=A0A1H4N880_TSUTY|nr:TetR/AcrR family transcriptional regulator [Tsukamurella tyrosinosolvens]KXO97060.1 TetR family transcriptional regulator [Tsukamurella tyrosinosolvens]QRY86083.1 TetR/AcrR family transcriptional regulator [Tsukamurella tyrosinosolvens]RDB45682.1 TetR/AcrR family transcriptional regulator [Tsukamurella tyrosinosolvens]SEB91491.1 DNA-binding transcriptional regulator, AcrR family [Tsukamurella tyrosinosolvens]VEI00375.1 transcriptional regulator BetI [Tsukamurella tyrosinosolvens]
MSGPERRAQILGIAAREFGAHGLHGASIEEVAREAGITQAYVFRMFGTKKALFLELVTDAFSGLVDAMARAGEGTVGIDALARMGAEYYENLGDDTALRLQLQGFAACGDPEVRAVVRGCFARLWDTTARGTGLDPVTVKTFLAFGMLLNAGAALDVADVDEPWADGVRTLIRPGLFEHITTATNGPASS